MAIPCILALNMVKLFNTDQKDLLYTTVSLSTILSSCTSTIHLHLGRSISSRNRLTTLIALVMTVTSVTCILTYNMIRMLFEDSYSLPSSLQAGYRKDDISQVFNYHLIADFIPGLLMFSQAILNTLFIHELSCKAKRSFTIGEASIVSQLVTMSFLTWALARYSNLTQAGPFQVSLTTDILLNIGVILFSLVFLPPYLFKPFSSKLLKCGLILLSLPICYSVSQRIIGSSSRLEPLTWVVDYIFTTHQRISLFSIWLSTVTACISFSVSWSRMANQTNSLVRKVFHLAICCIFITGYNLDLEFTKFAAGGAIVIFIFLEIIRAWQIDPLGRQLEDICKSLRGKWDNKYLTVSHLYLLVGTFLPVWLMPNHNGQLDKLTLSAGLISVGVGDTAAALVGTFIGSTRIRAKSDKTIEGLAGNLVAMLVFKQIWIGYTGFVAEFSFVLAAAFTAMIESTVTACDNLILPLGMLLLLEAF